ncbi:MAG: transposase [Paludibacter sp.]|nr:transposase [Paludibacter sp.]
MSINKHQDAITLIYSTLESNKFSTLKESRKQFIANVLLLFLSINGRINFLQLSRFSKNCEQFYRINFENKFNFQDFNLKLILEQSIKECIVAFDPSFISKSGKTTFGLNMYWSGCAKKAKWGLEICGFAAIDVLRNTAFHLHAIQTPPIEGTTLLVYYCQIVKEHYLYFKALSKYMVADAYFSKKEVVDTMLSLGLHFISRLRSDSNLKYKYTGKQNGKKGANKKYDGKFNLKSLKMNHFTIVISEDKVKVYSAIVYSVAFKRDIKIAVAVFYKDGKEINRKIYFSTHLDLGADKIFRYYCSRFQIEFLYRDAKQHCGLNNCQARSENKLNFHFNAALTAVNLAKVEWLNTKNDDNSQFSMSDYKTMYNNDLLLKTFIQRFGINPNTNKNKNIIAELRNWGKIAA